MVVSDECYAELAWDAAPVPSLLDPRVTGGSHEGLLDHPGSVEGSVTGIADVVRAVRTASPVDRGDGAAPQRRSSSTTVPTIRA